MARNLFSVPIFFIIFRETLEAAIIISVLLGLVEQIVNDDTHPFAHTDHQPAIIDEKKNDVSPVDTDEKKDDVSPANTDRSSAEVDAEPELAEEAVEMSNPLHKRRLIRKMRIQIFLGSVIGLFIALSIGAAFIAVWFTKASDLWAKSESLWEGTYIPLHLTC
ncbi:hypothetical protein EW146_g991 [Bondarzewia mesenterica]|uniref:Uncharacterized protein n=1 Tax=Bondarzewia mesenterica TaxID=1095465 RepID=A0A4S4M7I9_9AGAM|nr:hypothetical protein EW146_g991 [Bondarzewia mesenterica]